VARTSLAAKVLRALFARSGNRCAFPGCPAELINSKNQLIAQVCHIEAAEAGGERFNPTQSDEERRDYANLLILCYPHHVETDDINEYPVARLRKIKADHEAVFGQRPYKIDESLLYKLSFEMDEYWSKIDRLHKTEHIVPDLSVPVDVGATYEQLAKQTDQLIDSLSRWSVILADSDRSRYTDLVALLDEHGVLISSLDNDERVQRFRTGNWHLRNLALPNHLTRLRVLLVQMELQYLEAYLKLNANDPEARARLQERKSEFEHMATKYGLAD
jgi:hypothetical protein